MRKLRLLWASISFVWSLRKANWRTYLYWRLGTVYGIQPAGPDGKPDGTQAPKTLRELFRNLWADRNRAADFLLWRQEMLRLSRAGWRSRSRPRDRDAVQELRRPRSDRYLVH